ncbi:hypothetical protein A3K86_20130 [Photobacterium jeanii]|uniref:4Fe-4S ferredoxin-type domain-containing protein n=1 Tax=Photobacterium jeanii TaxID=858640 RepID=A0A178K2D6_9GAMM|nr:FeoB-associated Cys-rich membrane protein [Photobacterium jeanii]OAN11266.1 hypothetical protein A3K86_20130 [Photobacterium jeanii]PST90786.1 FeoB-associated Cys-rich membrane protein [Photobacterium jeanii]
MADSSALVAVKAATSWQDFAAVGVVIAIALAYLYRKLWKKKGQCGSCDSCPSGCPSSSPSVKKRNKH